MRAVALRDLRWVIAACALAAMPAQAQDADRAPDSADAAYAYAPPPSGPVGDTKPEDAAPPAPDDSAVLGQALLFDSASLAAATPVKPLKLPGLSAPKKFDVNRTDNADGTSKVVVKQPLATDWDSSIGADLNLAAPADSYRPQQGVPAINGNPGSGAAWASLGVAKFASVDARLDPANDQGKLGTTLKLPVGGNLSVTLQNTYSVTEAYNPLAPATTSAIGPSGLPLVASPPVTALTPGPAQIWGEDKNVKFTVQSTGTSFGADLASTTGDPVTHKTFSADQKLYGPLHVTTAVTDLGQATSSKSISAGFKLHW